MQALIDGKGAVDKSGREMFSYAHAIFWAPFSLVGDGGGRAAGSLGHGARSWWIDDVLNEIRPAEQN